MTRPVTSSPVKSGVAPGKADQTCAREKSRWLSLAALLAFYPGQLATLPVAGCPTMGACTGGVGVVSMVVEQPLGLLAAAPANAQEAAPLQLTVTPANNILMVSWDPPVGYTNSKTIEYDISYSDDGGSTWWPWHMASQLENLKVDILGLENGATYVVRVRARDSQDGGEWSALASATPVGVPGMPAQLDVTSGDQKLELTWVAPVDDGGSTIRDYDVQYSDDGGGTSTLWRDESPESNTLSEEITNLNNGALYHLRVRARNDVGHGPWLDWVPGQPVTIPAAPNPPTLTSGNRQLHVTWDVLSNDGGAPIGSYHVRYSDDSESTWNDWSLAADSRHLLHTTVTGLNNGVTYAVQVRARNHQGAGPWSGSASDRPVSVPAAPPRPTLTPGNKDLHVSWGLPSDDGGTPVSSYEIQYSSDDGFTWNEWDASIGSESLQATITGLQNGVVYTVQVRARNSQGPGAWSAAALDRPAGVPSAPIGLTVTPRPNQLDMNWDSPDDDGGAAITGYSIQYSSDRGDTWRPWYMSSQLDTLTASIPGLKNGAAYVVRVRARNSQGDGPWVTSESAMPVGVPAPPTQLDVSAGDGRLALSWVAPADDGGSKIRGYTIQYSNDRGDTWTPWNVAVDPQRLQEKLTGLENGTVYQVQVRASNGQGNGPWSVWETGRPATTPVAPTPPDLTPGNRELRVQWDAPEGDGGAPITGYGVQYSIDSGSSWREWHVSADAQPVLQATIAGLENGATYAVQVRARNGQGDGPWSDSALEQPVGVPTAPPSLTLTPGNRQLRVNWETPRDNGGAPISNYAIRYSNDSGATWTAWDGDIPVDSQSLEATISGLQNGTLYQVQVRAGNRQGDGPWSPLAEGQPRLLPPLPTWIQLPFAGVIWPIIIAIIAGSIASSFKIDIVKTVKDGWSFLKGKLPRKKEDKEEKPEDSVEPKPAEAKEENQEEDSGKDKKDKDEEA